MVFLSFGSNNTIILNLKMQSKEESETACAREDSLRLRLLPLFTTQVPQHPLSLSRLELLLYVFNYLQLLKFPFDYHSDTWLGQEQTALFVHLDPSFYTKGVTESTILVGCVVVMNVYVWVQVVVFLVGVEYSSWMVFTRKVTFLLCLHVLLVPFLRIIIGFFSEGNLFQTSFQGLSISFKLVFVASYLVFGCLLGVQAYLNFEFIPRAKEYTMLRKSSHTPLAFFLYFILSQIVVTLTSGAVGAICLTALTLILLGLVLFKDEQMEENAKLVELSFLAVMLNSFLVLFAMLVSGITIQFYAFAVVQPLVVAGVMQIKPYSLRFQLDNINKWPTPEIMMRYASTLRYYISRGEQYLFKVWVHGYMEIHRQKCDNIHCPSRCQLSDHDQKALEASPDSYRQEQLIRINNIIKVIYSAGYKLNPVPAELQLENSIFLFQRGEQELALRKLLMVDPEELPLDKFYMLQFLKQTISAQIRASGRLEFLDLVTQIQLQADEEHLLRKFERAALLNLEFWSILNDDHPDFQKLNEVSVARIRINNQVTQQFAQISRYAHSEKLTSQFANYLEAIQNDEHLVMDIVHRLAQEYQLANQIRVQDWANSSTSILLLSLEETTMGRIIEINTPCATLFGYTKNTLINQPASNLYPEGFYSHDKYLQFTDPKTNSKRLLLAHKNGYLLNLRKTARSYNSMAHGLAALIEIEPQIIPFASQLLVSKNKKIIGASSTLLSVLDLDLKGFEGETFTYQFFRQDLSKFRNDQEYSIGDVLKPDFVSSSLEDSVFSVSTEEYLGATFIEVKRQIRVKRESRVKKEEIVCTLFELRCLSTRRRFKYVGGSYFLIRNVKFKGLNFKTTQKIDAPTVDYGEGIFTYRLNDGDIEPVSQEEENISEKFIREEESSSVALEAIPRKDEEEIFQNKKSYQKFLDQHKIGKTMAPLLIFVVLLVFILYIVSFVVLSQKAEEVKLLASEVVYQNLIIGSIAQQARYINEFRLEISGFTSNGVGTLIGEFNQNLAYLQSISLKGSAPFMMTVPVGTVNVSQLSSLYTSSLINYATALSSTLAGVNTTTQLQSVLNSTSAYSLDFLLSGSSAKDIMMQNYLERQIQITDSVGGHVVLEVLLLLLGLVTLIVMGVVLVCCLNRLNRERLKVFEIFLFISEPLIQRFSSKTERFLISLQPQEGGEVVEEVDVKKDYSASMRKKKSFKLISFSKNLYIKILIVLVLMSAFFIHVFLVAKTNTDFQNESVGYFADTAKGDYIFASVGDTIARGALFNSTVHLQTESERIRFYYRDYRQKNEESFGLYGRYQDVFQLVFNSDICQGGDTPFGFVSIPRSCALPQLSPNGTSLIITNLYRHIYMESHTVILFVDLTFYSLPIVHSELIVLSDAQRKLSSILLQAQDQVVSNVRQQLLLALLMWIGISVAGALVIWGYSVRLFLVELNEIKSILGVLPVGLVRELPQALRYIKNMLEQSKSIF